MFRTSLLAMFTSAAGIALAELRVYYDFEKIAGTTVPNLADPDWPGRLHGAESPDLVAGAPAGGSPGTALWLDGIDDYVDLDIPASTLGMLDNGFAVTAWVMLDGMQAEAPILGQGSNVVFYFGFRNLVPRFRTSAIDVNAPAAFSPEPHRWVHCAWVRSQGLMFLYLDGVLAANVEAGGNHINGVDPHIGAISLNWFFRGAIDEFAIFSEPITLDQIRFLANGGRPDQLPPAAPSYFTAPFGPNGTWNLYEPRGTLPGQGGLRGWMDQLNAARVPNPLVPGDPRLGHLVWLESAAEHGYVRRIAGNLAPYWIGLSDNEAHGGAEGNFAWVGDPTNPDPPPLEFTRWQPGQPTDTPHGPSGSDGQDATLVVQNGDWVSQAMGGGSQPRILPRGAVIEWEVRSPDPIPGAEKYRILPEPPVRFPTPASTTAAWSLREVAGTTHIDSIDEAVTILLSRRGTITDRTLSEINHTFPQRDLAIHARASFDMLRAGTLAITNPTAAPLALRVAGHTAVLDPGQSTSHPLPSGPFKIELVTYSATSDFELSLPLTTPDAAAWRIVPARPAPNPHALAIRRHAPDHIALQWPAEPGKRYQILASDALDPSAPFLPLGHPVVGTRDPVEIPIPINTPKRFFRLQWDP